MPLWLLKPSAPYLNTVCDKSPKGPTPNHHWPPANAGAIVVERTSDFAGYGVYLKLEARQSLGFGFAAVSAGCRVESVDFSLG